MQEKIFNVKKSFINLQDFFKYNIIFQKGKQTIVVPKFGKYRTIFSPDIDDHMEQVKIENKEEKEDVRWYIFLNSTTIYDYFDY